MLHPLKKWSLRESRGGSGSGSSATTNPSGLVRDPYPDIPANSSAMYFRGEIAAADIDNDGSVEIVGTYGDDNVYVIREDSTLVWSQPCKALAGVTLADIDKLGDGKMEVLVNSWANGSLYAYKSNGTAFRNGNPVFHDLSGDAQAKYNFAGVAVGNLGGDSKLEIIQPSTNGRLYVLNTDGTTYWSAQVHTQAVPVSTPVVAKLRGTSQYDVAVALPSAGWRLVMLQGNNGTAIAGLTASGNSDLELDTVPVQAPAVADLNGVSGGALELVIPHKNMTQGDPLNRVSLLHRTGTSTIRTVASDSIPIPGRREELYAKTVGNVAIADLEGDGVKEVLAVSNQGAAFAWEVVWNSMSSMFTCKAKKGWPLVFDEQPGTVAIGNIDSDSAMELVVATDDGYVHTYDLPGVASGNIYWGAAGHDARRTGNYDAGSSGPVPQHDPLDDLLPGGSKVLGTGRNPTPLGTTIAYEVPGTTRVTIDIIDVTGRRVRRVQDATVTAGAHVAGWDGRDDRGTRVAAGVYFARVVMGELEATRKITVGR